MFENEDDIVTNQIWSEALNMDVKELNILEQKFLAAIVSTFSCSIIQCVLTTFLQNYMLVFKIYENNFIYVQFPMT